MLPTPLRPTRIRRHPVLQAHPHAHNLHPRPPAAKPVRLRETGPFPAIRMHGAGASSMPFGGGGRSECFRAVAHRLRRPVVQGRKTLQRAERRSGTYSRARADAGRRATGH
ncbi:hypothetical protein A176_003196 [Myxococcus hansupus]|uniref:Uncharacterized protein n=1 Tax=Pseudomyxococcus hansupus TaxID=1297742 RepID=A0A0H4WTZ4_9BACT|nr:hypothetical protein A176_003196 [Myxococcus hansupus]